MKFFIDLSNNNGPAVRVDEITAAGVYLKASEGGTFTDPYRATWQAGLEARGVPTGTYHFHRGTATVADQLHRWIDSGLHEGAWRPVLDCEDTERHLDPAAMSASCLALAEQVAHETGVAPIIYTGGWWIGNYASRDPAWGLYDLWLSAYPLGNSRPPTDGEAAQWFAAEKYDQPPAPWTEVLAWQFTSIAQVPGVPGNCDRSITADVSRLARLQPAAHEAVSAPLPVLPAPTVEDDDVKHVLVWNGNEYAQADTEIHDLAYDPPRSLGKGDVAKHRAQFLIDHAGAVVDDTGHPFPDQYGIVEALGGQRS